MNAQYIWTGDFGEMMYKKTAEILAEIWDQSKGGSLTCPQCGGKLIVVQIEPIYDAENAYVPYDTVIECSQCDFKIRAESFTILGSVKDFDAKYIDIASWGPSGSRVLSHYEHILDYERLKKEREANSLKGK